MRHLIFTVFILIVGNPAIGQQMQMDKKRTIVTTDGEIDDVDTFIRFLLYTNEFDTEGLIYSSSMWHWKGDGKGTTMLSEMEMTRNIYGERSELRWPGTSWIQELLAEYEKVHPNLLLHDKNYPSAEALLKLVKVGNIDFEGEMDKSYPQTRWIKPIQLDFAARADWCIKSFEEANHPPKIKVVHGNAISADVGETITLDILGEDVDGDSLYFKVWSYAEAGDGPASIDLKTDIASVQIPKSAQSGNEYHIIVEGTDTGFPALTRYQRVIISIP